MKPVDGQHRGLKSHSAWCRNLHASLAEGGTWVVPRSGLTFTRRGDLLVLTKRDTGYDARDQQADFSLNRRMFALAGITINDETEGKQR